jgi:hypothetical protein
MAQRESEPGEEAVKLYGSKGIRGHSYLHGFN